MSDASRILRPADWQEQPWPNGGGVTHEIASEYDGDTLLWRFSTARVDCDGAYSLFPGLVRISTVIEGPGTLLRDTATGAEIDIQPLTPTNLEGDALYEGSLKGEPLRHLNFFFNPSRVNADVQTLCAYGTKATHVIDGTTLIFCVAGTFEMQNLTVHGRETLIGPAISTPLRLDPGAVVIAVAVKRIELE